MEAWQRLRPGPDLLQLAARLRQGKPVATGQQQQLLGPLVSLLVVQHLQTLLLLLLSHQVRVHKARGSQVPLHSNTSCSSRTAAVLPLQQQQQLAHSSRRRRQQQQVQVLGLHQPGPHLGVAVAPQQQQQQQQVQMVLHQHKAALPNPVGASHEACWAAVQLQQLPQQVSAETAAAGACTSNNNSSSSSRLLQFVVQVSWPLLCVSMVATVAFGWSSLPAASTTKA